MPFPLHALAPWHRDMVQAVADSTQTDPNMAALFGIGILSGTLGRGVLVEGPGDYTNPLNLWVIVVGESASGKSSTFNRLMAPLEEVQMALEGARGPAASTSTASPRRRTRHEALMADDLFTEEVTTDAGTSLEEVVDAIRVRQDQVFPGVPASFLTHDTTPTATRQRMESQILGIIQASPEGGFTDWIRQSSEIGNLNLAWDGQNIRAQRAGRDRHAAVERACLTMVVGPQPESYAQATSGRLGVLLREQGYLFRCLYGFPESRVGSQVVRNARIDAGIVSRYTNNVRAMLLFGVRRIANPWRLSLTPGARDQYVAFHDEIERRRGAGGDLHAVHPWAARLRQSVLRVAGQLHVASEVTELAGEFPDLQIKEATMRSAVEIGESLIPAGVQAFGRRPTQAGPEPRTGVIVDIRATLESGEQFRSGTFAVRDVHRRVQRRHDAGAVREALDALVREGVLSRRMEGTRALYWFRRGDSDDGDSR